MARFFGEKRGINFFCHKRYLVKRYKNLICVKSFSKDYGLAGLRLGFILADKDFIVNFKKIISPYSVNAMAVFAGIQALLDAEHFEFVKNEVKKSKEFLLDIQFLITPDGSSSF